MLQKKDVRLKLFLKSEDINREWFEHICRKTFRYRIPRATYRSLVSYSKFPCILGFLTTEQALHGGLFQMLSQAGRGFSNAYSGWSMQCCVQRDSSSAWLSFSTDLFITWWNLFPEKEEEGRRGSSKQLSLLELFCFEIYSQHGFRGGVLIMWNKVSQHLE